jgi:hypothetical protein
MVLRDGFLSAVGKICRIDWVTEWPKIGMINP